jgi:hypothetical protein
MILIWSVKHVNIILVKVVQVLMHDYFIIYVIFVIFVEFDYLM